MPMLVSHREDHHGSRLGLSELPYLGHDLWPRARPGGLPRHRHAQWELCWLARGRMTWEVEGERCELRGGDCFLTRPDERHGGIGGVQHPGELYWATVAIDRLPGLAPRHARILRQGFARLSRRRFPGSAAVGAAFAELLAEFRCADALAPLAARAALHRLLAAVLRAASAGQTAAVTPPVLRALELIEEALARPPRVAALAAAVGLGASRFHARFRAEVGCAPAEHIARRRVARAQELLRRGQTITTVAAELGFASRGHFGAVFRRLTGQAPGRWRCAGTTSSSRRSSR